MEKNKVIVKKQKFGKNKLRKLLLFVAIPSFIGIILVSCIIIMSFLLSGASAETAQTVALCLTSIVLASGIALIFICIPVARVAQAMSDLENYDFIPYFPRATEGFCVESPIEKFYFESSPFDSEEPYSFDFSSSDAAEKYFSLFPRSNLRRIEKLGERTGFTPFYVVNMSGGGMDGRIDEDSEGNYRTVTVTKKNFVLFKRKKIETCGKVYDYSDITSASVFARFPIGAPCAEIRLEMVLDNNIYLNFAFGTRIMSIIDKHEIEILNRPLADKIMKDPERAFRNLALKCKLR